jgi:1-acyl-sn-glycerol-3-phosphate acyltransferase
MLVLVLPKRDWRHDVVRAAAAMFLKVTGTPVNVIANSPMLRRQVVLVANHSSYLDPVVITAVVPGPLTFVAKEELAGQRVAGPFLRRLGTIFVRRTVAAGGVEDTERQRCAARDGERLVTFPEGTLTRMPGLLGFRLGAFLVAAQEGVPVIPVTLIGTRAILRGEQWLPRRGMITIRFDAPVFPDGDDFAAAVRLRDRVRAVLLEHCAEPDLAHERIELPTEQSLP